MRFRHICPSERLPQPWNCISYSRLSCRIIQSQANVALSNSSNSSLSLDYFRYQVKFFAKRRALGASNEAELSLSARMYIGCLTAAVSRKCRFFSNRTGCSSSSTLFGKTKSALLMARLSLKFSFASTHGRVSWNADHWQTLKFIFSGRSKNSHYSNMACTSDPFTVTATPGKVSS